MKNCWKIARNGAAILTILLGLYVLGFGLVRIFYVDLISPGRYHSQKLVTANDGILGKVIDFYQHSFELESKIRGSDSTIINAWSVGMRLWP